MSLVTNPSFATAYSLLLVLVNFAQQFKMCNRTYYGDVGKTYQLSLHKPQEGRLPFLCHLTFTANGHSHGELVQLMFDAFTVGRFSAAALDGCPDGHMQLLELGRPFTGGSWCGAAAGRAVYYSETATVTLTLRVYHAAAPFEFLLRYKMLGADEAVVRFGSAGAPIDRGEVVPGTYCSRNFYECYRKKCRLQSPNYPGMYPRNVTCYLTLRQKTVPTCKHAMISVRQQSEHKMQIRSTMPNVGGKNGTSATSSGGGGGGSRELRAWSECTSDRDHLIFYDGASTDDPVIAKYCGGTWLPAVISRGPQMLVAFHSSPFSVPLRSDAASSPLRGFELDVDVLYSDSSSLDYSRNARKCEFWVNATHPDLDDTARTRGRAGYLNSPRHTLPPNTTCTWHFRGHQSRDHVWLYFVSYAHQPLRPNTTHNCSTRLRIWDGGGSLLGDHCDGPRLCDHTSLRNQTRVTRPCLLTESYVTRTNQLLVQHQSDDGTALHPAHFRARYEFVDTWLGGEPWAGRKGEPPPPQPCSRVFRKVKSGYIKSPRNIFLYGRGGATNLSCVYRLEAGSGEKVRLTLHNASFGETECTADRDPHTGRAVCVRQPGARLVELQVADVPWRDVRVVRGCYCDNSTIPVTSSPNSNVVFTSLSRILEITFVISKFNITEDFADLYFHASFEMVRSNDCPRKQRVRGSGGEIELVSPPQLRADIYCEGLPWLVEAHENKSLFLLTWGHFLPLTGEPDSASCSTRNRVLLYTGRPLRLLKVVCPSTPKDRQFAVHVFSEEWYLQPPPGGSELFLQPPRPPSFLLEFVGRETGVAALNWLEISRSKSALLQQLHTDYPDTLEPPGNESVSVPGWECPYRCPELNACISSSLWCDGRPNCPSGYDESPAHCGVGRQLLAILPTYAAFGGVAATIAALLLFLLAALLHRVRLRRRRRLLATAHRVPTEELLLPSTATSTISS